MGRAPCCAKVGLKKGRWTAEEDQILINYITANGEGSWRSLPKNAGLLRCGKSCRLRWINYLRADLKRGNISKEEEELIVKLHTSLGNRWSLIASHLPGRTDNEIKNYWNSHLSRKIDSFSTNGSGGGGGSDGEAVTAGHSGKQRGGRSTGKKKYSTKEKRKDVSSLNSAAQSDETQASSVTVTSEGPNCEMLSGLLSPSIMDSGLLEMSNDMEELDAIFLDPSDSSGSGVAMSTSEEREGGSMVLNSEGESGPVGLKEGRRGDGTVVGQSEIMDQMEEVVEVGQPFDWDLERLETELLNGAGETWAWHEEEGYQQDSFASWLLSDAI